MDVAKYVGRPFVPLHFDCWALVREVYKNELQRDLPNVTAQASNLAAVARTFKNYDNIKERFTELTSYQDMAVVVYGRGVAIHVGIYLDIMGGRILHNHADSGVVLEHPDRMKLPIMGIYG